MPKLDAYDRRAEYSYCLGVYPCHALMDSHPERALRLLLHPDGLKSEGVARLRERCAQAGVREEMAERVLRREAKKDNCFAGIAFQKYECALHAARSHAVFCQISDLGNLGTALRAALGFGFTDVALIRPCADAFDPHTLRASMGAYFRLNVSVFDDFDAYRAAFPAHALYPFMLDGAIPLSRAAKNAKAPYSLVFGNEASGLPARFAGLGQSVKIEQSDLIDSLNLAVAASIAMYTFANTENG